MGESGLWKDCFLHTAAFENSHEDVYSVPLSVDVIKQLTEDNNQFVYVKNTYRLGYSSMEKIHQYAQSGSMDNICLAYMKVDGVTIANGDIDALLVE